MRAAAVNVESRSTNLSLLHPRMRSAVDAVIADLKSANIPLFVFEAFRAPERQAHLYAQGGHAPE